MACAATNRHGEVSINRHGSPMEIIDYINAHNVIARFQNGYIAKCEYKDFRRGKVRNPYDRTVYGVGYIGEGPHAHSVDGEQTAQSVTWNSMMCRCYSDKLHKRSPSYSDCSVHPEWHNFQMFAKWYDDNYYELDDATMCLDKDILTKGNKVYSPTNCVFVPDVINGLFVKADRKRGDAPIGVSYHKRLGKYQAYCNTGFGGAVCLGYYDAPDDAFSAYKTKKEETIKITAEKYKGKIPDNLYCAMKKYSVEADD